MQSLFYMLQYEREAICEKYTNKFFWKIAKHLVDDTFVQNLNAYRALGPKEEEYKKYQTLNFIEKNLEGVT